MFHQKNQCITPAHVLFTDAQQKECAHIVLLILHLPFYRSARTSAFRTPPAGFEPATSWLTAMRSAIELWEIEKTG